MTDNVVPGTFSDSYTSRNRVTRPPMYTDGGSLFPRAVTLFGQGRRVSRASFQSLVPKSRSSFWFLVPRSSSSFLVPRSSFRFLVPTYRFITILMRYDMSNYDNQGLRYSCLCEPMQGSPYHPRSLTLLCIVLFLFSVYCYKTFTGSKCITI